MNSPIRRRICMCLCGKCNGSVPVPLNVGCEQLDGAVLREDCYRVKGCIGQGTDNEASTLGVLVLPIAGKEEINNANAEEVKDR